MLYMSSLGISYVHIRISYAGMSQALEHRELVYPEVAFQLRLWKDPLVGQLLL